LAYCSVEAVKWDLAIKPKAIVAIAKCLECGLAMALAAFGVWASHAIAAALLLLHCRGEEQIV